MRTVREIEALLDELERCCANDLEGQDLDFKEWSEDGKRSFGTAVDWAVCMANGGGGAVVFGVADKVTGREQAIRGVPPEVEVNRLKQAVYDGTDPKLTPVFEELRVPEGTGRLIVMLVYDGIPPYTDTAGRGFARVGKDCKPLTGTMRRNLAARWGDDDFTAETVDGRGKRLISAAAMETLRRTAAAAEKAPPDLLRLGDGALLEAVGVRRNGRMTRAALLLCGTEEALRDHVPGYLWTHLRMKSETDYSDRADGRDAIPVALSRIMDRVLADNLIETVRRGPYHFEYRTYPEVALREALMNALCHADHRIASPILVKQFPKRIEMVNAGGLIGGTTPDNFLHRAPVTRNPCLVGALVRLRLVNRSALGMHQIFCHFLMEGKPHPSIEDLGGFFRLVFRASGLSAPFRAFVADEAVERDIHLGVDHLLVLHHLLGEAEIGAVAAARLCQRSPAETREILTAMERDFGYLETAERGTPEVWTMTAEVRARITRDREAADSSVPEWAAAKTEVEAVIRRRAARGEASLSNADVRRITGFDQRRVNRLIHELGEEGKVRIAGHGRAARYLWIGSPAGGK